MQTIQPYQAPQFLDEVALLQIIDTIQSLLNLFQQQINNDMKILILVGVTGSGKSTIFNLLCGAKFKLIESEDGVEELDLEETSSEFSVMKGGMKSVTKEPNYYFNEEYNHLLIDFPGFQDTNDILNWIFKKEDQIYKNLLEQHLKSRVLVQKAYLYYQMLLMKKIIQMKKLQHQQENKQINNIILVAIIQMQQFLEKQMNKMIQLGNFLRKREEKCGKTQLNPKKQNLNLFKFFIRKKQVIIQVEKAFNIQKVFAHKYKQIQLKNCKIYIQKTLQYQRNQVLNLKNYQKLKKKNFLQWFEIFAIVSTKIAQQLGCLEIVKQKSEEFQKIYLFFSQFSNFINGYFECIKYGTFASTQYHDMMKIIDNKIEFLKEKQKVEQTIAEKNQEIQLKNIAMSRAEQQRNQKKKYQQQYQKLKICNKRQFSKKQKRINQKKKLIRQRIIIISFNNKANRLKVNQITKLSKKRRLNQRFKRN
ncbi:unnamed protein product [Paramecium pentaurelia]|uniref:G domain-containing protein n=1 Tax=Paramecium pentaurelia TaxID=43138 RepID=A0A8S1VUC5_9CILI|nr:unnamed protein product [Paramecium pentaurelia]